MPWTRTLRKRCGHCFCAVELGFAPWIGHGPAVSAEWACPRCGGANHVPVIGEVIWVDLRTTTPGRPERARPTLTRVH